MKNNIVQQIVIAGILTALGILVGSFAHFTFFGQVYLVGIIVFIMPMFLRLDLLIVSSVTTVVLSDLISGFGYYSWISAIAYFVAVIILYLFNKMKFKWIYMLGLIIAACSVILIYFLIEWKVFSLGYAIKDLISTSIEMSICCTVVSLLFIPMRIVSQVTK